MAETVCRVLRERTIPTEPRPYILNLTEPDGRAHRVALSRPERLMAVDHLVVVGFCGQRRPNVECGPVNAVDAALVAELPEHQHLLSYSTMQRLCGNSANLVLFDHIDGLNHWSQSKKHAEALALSPGYYTSIRLHNGLLRGGLTGGNAIELTRTKYFEFGEQAVWRAIRELRAH